MSVHSVNQSKEGEISPIQIVKFFLESWKNIFFFGVLGVVGGIFYLYSTPKEYEVVAQVQLAQVLGNPGTYSLVNLEDSGLVLSRLKSATFYLDQDYLACEINPIYRSQGEILKLLNISILDGVNSVLVIKIRMKSNEVAVSCINTIINKLNKTQNDILVKRSKAQRDQLASYRLREVNIKKMIEQARESKLDLPTTYLMYFDEIRFIRSEILRLENLLAVERNEAAQLLVPISVKDSPVWPAKKIVLGISLFIGFIMGFFFTLATKFSFFLKIKPDHRP
jgi:hypothetical protein